MHSIREESLLAAKKLTKCCGRHSLHPFLHHTRLIFFFFVKKQFIISEIFSRAYRASEGWNELFRSEIPEKNTYSLYHMVNHSPKVSFILTSEQCGLQSEILVEDDIGEEELIAGK